MNVFLPRLCSFLYDLNLKLDSEDCDDFVARKWKLRVSYKDFVLLEFKVV